MDIGCGDQKTWNNDNIVPASLLALESPPTCLNLNQIDARDKTSNFLLCHRKIAHESQCCTAVFCSCWSVSCWTTLASCSIILWPIMTPNFRQDEVSFFFFSQHHHHHRSAECMITLRLPFQHFFVIMFDKYSPHHSKPHVDYDGWGGGGRWVLKSYT